MYNLRVNGPSPQGIGVPRHRVCAMFKTHVGKSRGRLGKVETQDSRRNQNGQLTFKPIFFHSAQTAVKLMLIILTSFKSLEIAKT